MSRLKRREREQRKQEASARRVEAILSDPAYLAARPDLVAGLRAAVGAWTVLDEMQEVCREGWRPTSRLVLARDMGTALAMSRPAAAASAPALVLAR